MTVMKSFLVLSTPRSACLLTSQSIFCLAILALFTLCPSDLVSHVCPSSATMETGGSGYILTPSSLEVKHWGDHLPLLLGLTDGHNRLAGSCGDCVSGPSLGPDAGCPVPFLPLFSLPSPCPGVGSGTPERSHMLGSECPSSPVLWVLQGLMHDGNQPLFASPPLISDLCAPAQGCLVVGRGP